MKVTQNPKTGKLIVEGEGATIFVTRAIPGNDPVELVKGFNIRPLEKAKPPKGAGVALSIG